MATLTTAIAGPPLDRSVVLYDGDCRFCQGQMDNLLRLARRGAIEGVDFQADGVLARFDALTHGACMQAMHLVTPEGRVFVGMEAAARAVTTRPVLGLVGWLYYLPGVRQLLDALYRLIAKNRYRIAGRRAATDCESGACAVHFDDP